MALPVRKGYNGAPAQAVLTNNPGGTDADTTFIVDTVTKWGAVPFYCVVEPGTSREEKVKVTAISTLTLTVVRGVDNTNIVAHASGAAIYPVFTAVEADEANQIASVMTTKGDIIGTNGSSINRLGIGTNTHVLQADSTATNGFKWGQIVEAGIADSAVTSAKIAANTIVLADLATALVDYLVPVGTINAYGGASAPTGWLLCDGTSTSGYAALAAIVGATTPDMRGLFPMGKTAAGTGSTLRGTGGSTTITESNMPSHTHIQNSHGHATASAPCGGAIGEIGLQATGTGPYTLFEVALTQQDGKANQISFAPQVATAVNQSTGGGTGYYQPFIALNYIIKH